MLAYLLALVVGLSSVALYMAAFFFPEVHRKHDFLWSGLGMFYALVLWVCAGRITGGVLLGQTASVVLLGWMGWQMLALRRQVAPVDQQTAVPTPAEWQAALSQAWAGLSSSKALAPIARPIGKQVAKLTAWVEALVTTTTTTTSTPPPEVERPYVPLTPADFANARQTAVPLPKPIATDTLTQTGVNGQSQEKGQSKENVQAKENAMTGLFKGLTAKRESKPVYVRKQFRTPETEAADAGAKPSNPAVVDLPPEPSILEEPSTLEAIDVTFTETTAPSVSVSPPSTDEAEPTSEKEPSP
ncbi:MAG: Ycf66 family protein [Lyngbya sp. HA4199-MV5]|nr:Ycf66 family protein [Lyngbya sp. HA4199-MV5]